MPPTWERLYRFVRDDDDGRETTEDEPRIVSELDVSGCETIKAGGVEDRPGAGKASVCLMGRDEARA